MGVKIFLIPIFFFHLLSEIPLLGFFLYLFGRNSSASVKFSTHPAYPPPFKGDMRNIPIRANRFGKTHMVLFSPMKTERTILISLERQYSTKSEMLKKWRLGVSCHA